ncbi:MAG: alpha/beta hydrolase, partial [Spirochaetaceae bacterium]|nr:alpha/beta hydrolase [Spirochaetaceae bacterium]
PAILLVHGNLGSSVWYERVMSLRGLRSIALDMPNFGRSGPFGVEVDIDCYADAVWAFIEALKLDRPILVAHSLGGAVATSLAVRRPGSIRGLVLVDSAAPSGMRIPEERYPYIELMRTNRDFLARSLKAAVPTLADEAYFQRLVEDAALMAGDAFSGNARALDRFDYTGRCAAFPGPTMVLWGALDVIVTEAMARETAAAFPGARLEILDGVGHSVMAEDPAGFISLVEEFAAGSGKP